jgi:hypothetical protein
MTKKKKNLIIIVSVFLVVGGYFGWQAYKMANFYDGAQETMQDAQAFWTEYESQPQNYYIELSKACDSLLESYKEYTDYPYNISLDNNPVMPETILREDPKRITVWAKDHISVTMLTIGDGGFHITWKKDPSGKWNLFLGGSPDEGHVVYER